MNVETGLGEESVEKPEERRVRMEDGGWKMGGRRA
jgi:hypothetical protein